MLNLCLYLSLSVDPETVNFTQQLYTTHFCEIYLFAMRTKEIYILIYYIAMESAAIWGDCLSLTRVDWLAERQSRSPQCVTHLPHMWGPYWLPIIDTDTRDCQLYHMWFLNIHKNITLILCTIAWPKTVNAQIHHKSPSNSEVFDRRVWVKKQDKLRALKKI
jgi:hypothetical protein